MEPLNYIFWPDYDLYDWSDAQLMAYYAAYLDELCDLGLLTDDMDEHDWEYTEDQIDEILRDLPF